MDTLSEQLSVRTRVGVHGLDDILAGGLPRRRLFLVRGRPGTGKTTLALQFLAEGRRSGERCLYVTLSETKEELASVAHSHGWSLDGIDLIDLSSVESQLPPATQTLLHPAEVELGRMVKLIESEVERLRPHRVVLDSLSELRLIAQSPLRYRRQILAFKTFFTSRQCTALMLDDDSDSQQNNQVESLAHGVIELEHLRPEYGAERRRLSVLKLRGVRFRGGFHDYVIRTGGLDVFPRIVAAEHHSDFERERISSGVVELDALLGGGLDRGTSNLFLGPAGCGKSTIAQAYVAAATSRGERAGVFLFDENSAVFEARARALGMDLRPQMASGMMMVQQVDPAELAPGEFGALVRKLVDVDGIRLLVIDSLNGFFNAMPEERFLLIQLHELLTYLAQRGVTTILVVAQHGLMGAAMTNPVDLTYLADTVLLLRYFEFDGSIRKAVSVVKKRSGPHEQTIRELSVRQGEGVRVSEPLTNFRGILSGTPTYVGKSGAVFSGEGDGRA